MMKTTVVFIRLRLLRCLAAVASAVLVMAAAEADDDPELRAVWVTKLKQHAVPLQQDVNDYNRLIESIGDARVVMLGEGTHGSAEFFEQRARITQRLIAEKGFSAVILEAAWAPTLRLNAYVHGEADATDTASALQGFRRFPWWTWRHAEFAAFLDTLKTYNAGRSLELDRVSLYGMDIYEAPEAINDVIAFLRQAEPEAVRGARRDYRCFAPYTRLDRDPSLYGRDVARGWMPSCAKLVAARLGKIAAFHANHPSPRSLEATLSARAVVGAEAYYRSLYADDGVTSWNQREHFLAESIDLLLARHGKVVVWAHNSHQGDARASDVAANGELTIGQLMRERHGTDAVFLVGMTTYSGTVRAASGWATRDTIKNLRPALTESWPGVFHEVGIPAFLIDFRSAPTLAEAFDHALLDRAVGVNYLPLDEMRNHYSKVSIGRYYDAVVHIDITRAVRVQADRMLSRRPSQY
jgi:erythromycin esterase-like protein